MLTHATDVLPACPRSAAAREVPATVGQARWLRAAEDEIDAACFRADARRNALVIARAIGWAADWSTGRTRPTLARLQEVSGLSLRSVQRWTRWLERQGLLDVLEPGTTPQYRPGILTGPDAGNLAREWRLVVPGDVSGTPPVLGFTLGVEPEVESPTRAPARPATTGNEARRFAPDCPFPPSLPASPPWPPGRNPQRRRDRLAAAEQLRSEHLVLRRIPARALRSVLREFFAAGATPADILHALEHGPDDTARLHSDPVRFPAAWLASRLAAWRGPDGTPVPPHSARLAERVEVDREQARCERDRLGRQAPADPAPYAAQVREALARIRDRDRTNSGSPVLTTSGVPLFTRWPRG
ncbi:MAG: hypothetical protein ACRDNZ_24015 [Streptosporangiaceae bacterium]